MPWFRWKNKQKDEQGAPQSVATEVAAPAEPELTDELESTGNAVADTEAGEALKRKRRRGSRGGRGRKKPGTGAADVASDEPAPSPTAPREPAREKAERSQRAERAADRRRSQGGTQRRRQPPRRAPLPAAKRELLISVDIGEQRVAVIEDDRVAEVYLERPERRSIAGNIYLGVVDNVLPGMEAAFVEIGLEKNGFLYVDEIVVPELEGKRHGKKIQDLISRGEQLLVQAVKDPMKTKGRAADDGDLAPRPVPRLRPERRRAWCLAAPRGLGARTAEGHHQGPRGQRGRRDRAHRGGGRVGRGRRARPRLPAAPLEDDPDARQGREGADARLSGSRAAPPHRARPLRRGLRVGSGRQRARPQANRRAT